MDTLSKWRVRHETEGFFTLKKVPGEGLCMVKGCRKESHSRKFGLCHGCYQYRWRMINRKPSAYATLRDHAKGRGLSFTMAFDYFCGLMDCAAYWDHEAESRGEWLTIDRIDATRGYEPGNCRVISTSHNSVKSHRERYLPAHVQAILNRKRARAKENPALACEQVPDEDACPF